MYNSENRVENLVTLDEVIEAKGTETWKPSTLVVPSGVNKEDLLSDIGGIEISRLSGRKGLELRRDGIEAERLDFDGLMTMGIYFPNMNVKDVNLGNSYVAGDIHLSNHHDDSDLQLYGVSLGDASTGSIHIEGIGSINLCDLDTKGDITLIGDLNLGASSITARSLRADNQEPFPKYRASPNSRPTKSDLFAVCHNTLRHGLNLSGREFETLILDQQMIFDEMTGAREYKGTQSPVRRDSRGYFRWTPQ